MRLVVNLPKPSVDCYQNALGYELGFLMDLIFTENVIKTVFKSNVVENMSWEEQNLKLKSSSFFSTTLLFWNFEYWLLNGGCLLKRWPLNGGSTLETIVIKFRGNDSAYLRLDGAL